MTDPNILKAALGGLLPSGISMPATADPDRHVDVDEMRAEQLTQRLTPLIPARYRHAVVTNSDVAAWTTGFLAGHTGSLLLLGMVGRGKTHQAFGAIRKIVEVSYPRSLSIFGGPTPDLVDAARPGQGVDSREVIGSYRESDLLLLDDLGVEKRSDWVAERLYEVIDYRYRHLRPMIVVSNLPLTAVPGGETRTLIDHLGDRLVSRLCEMCRIVVISGPDRRVGR